MSPNKIQLTACIGDLKKGFPLDPRVRERVTEPTIDQVAEVIASGSEILGPGPDFRDMVPARLLPVRHHGMSIFLGWLWPLPSSAPIGSGVIFSLNPERSVVADRSCIWLKKFDHWPDSLDLSQLRDADLTPLGDESTLGYVAQQLELIYRAGVIVLNDSLCS